MTDWKEEITQWLTSGSDKSEDPIDLIWNVREENGTLIADHPKVPFTLYISIDTHFIRMSVFTGLNTALLDPVQRLDISRKLLLLNDRIDLVKYVIRGVNEEIVLRSELDLIAIAKKEFDDVLTGLIAALFLMIKEFKLEEQFNKELSERVILMIKERMDKGATKQDLLDFLVNKVGMDSNSADKLLNEIIKSTQEVSIKPGDSASYQ